MPGHVPHVGDAGSGERELGRRVQGALGLPVVPEMDAEMMRRMHRGFRQDLLEQGIDSLVAAERDLRGGVGKLPDPRCEESLRLDVIGKAMDQVFEVAYHLLPPRLFIGGLAIEIVRLGGDVWLALPARLLDQALRLFDETFRAFLILPVGHRHAPVGHRTIGVMGGDLPERPLCLVIPESMKLPQPLVEVSLAVLPRGLDGNGDIASALDEAEGPARAFVEGFTLMGVPGLDLFHLVAKKANGEGCVEEEDPGCVGDSQRWKDGSLQ